MTNETSPCIFTVSRVIKRIDGEDEK